MLLPLGPGGDRRYRLRCHDLATDTELDDEPWHEAPTDAVLLFDAVLAQRKEFKDHWDMVIFVQVRFDEAYRRLAQRDGLPSDPSHPDNARYYGAQQYYLGTYHPERSADAVVDNNDWRHPRIVRLW